MVRTYGELCHVPSAVWLLVVQQFTAWVLMCLQSFYWTSWVANCVSSSKAPHGAVSGGNTTASLGTDGVETMLADQGQLEDLSQGLAWGTITLLVGTVSGILASVVLHKVNDALGTKQVYWYGLVISSIGTIFTYTDMGRTLEYAMLLQVIIGAAAAVYYDNPYVLMEEMLPPNMHAQYVSLLTNSMTLSQLLVSVVGWLTVTSICSVTNLFVCAGLVILLLQIFLIVVDYWSFQAAKHPPDA